MSVLSHLGYIAGGAALAGATSAATKKGSLHDGVVKVVAAGMRVADTVSAAAQSVADDAADVNAEARRQARIDAAVRERLAELEEGIRAEVTAEIDGTDAE